MKRILLLLFLILLIIDIGAQVTEKDLRKIVIDQIQTDLSQQDTSYFLFEFSAGVEKKKWRGDKYNDTIQFVFLDGIHLRFYFITSNVAKSEAQISLLRIDPDKKKNPPVKLKELYNAGSNLQTVTFDYHTKSTEYFLIVIRQSPEQNGISYMAATQYLPKK